MARSRLFSFTTLGVAIATALTSLLLFEAAPAEARPGRRNSGNSNYNSGNLRYRNRYRQNPRVIIAPSGYGYGYPYGYYGGSSLSVQSSGLSITIGNSPIYRRGYYRYPYRYPYKGHGIYSPFPVIVRPTIINPSYNYPNYNPNYYPNNNPNYYPGYPEAEYPAPPSTINSNGNAVGPGRGPSGSMIQAPFGVQIR